jgi:hypothetical protein
VFLIIRGILDALDHALRQRRHIALPGAGEVSPQPLKHIYNTARSPITMSLNPCWEKGMMYIHGGG